MFFFFLQGETARVLVRNGDMYEGVLKAVSPKVSYVLNYFTSHNLFGNFGYFLL